MSLTLVLTVLLALAAGIITWLVASRGSAGAWRNSDIVAEYRARIDELERANHAGQLSSEDVRQRRAEIDRRLLDAASTNTEPRRDVLRPGGRTIASVMVVSGFCAGAALLYFASGRSEMDETPSAMPRHALIGLPARSSQTLPPRLLSAGTELPQSRPAQSQRPPAGDVGTLIARLAERLESEPGDLQGWQMLGWSYSRTGKYGEAAGAYSKAVALAPGDAELRARLGEALTQASGGRVNETALSALNAALELDPENARAGYYKGLALDQSGDKRGALDLWEAVLVNSSPDAEWVPGLTQRIRESAEALGAEDRTR